MKTPSFDLEDRFVEWTCRMIDVVEALPNTRAGNYIANQMIRSSHSPTFNYGEVQGAESRNDFVHKLGICLKELKETRTGLKIIIRKDMIKKEKLMSVYCETEELVAIIAKSINTAEKNRLTKTKTN